MIEGVHSSTPFLWENYMSEKKDPLVVAIAIMFVTVLVFLQSIALLWSLGVLGVVSEETITNDSWKASFACVIVISTLSPIGRRV